MNLSPVLYVMYGMLLGAIIFSAIIKKRTAKAVRSKIVKLTETHTIAVTDFAGKEVSLDSFCAKVLGPDVLVQPDPGMRKTLLATLVFFAALAALIAFAYFH